MTAEIKLDDGRVFYVEVSRVCEGGYWWSYYREDRATKLDCGVGRSLGDAVALAVKALPWGKPLVEVL